MKSAAQQILKKNFISFLLLLVFRCCFAGSAANPTSFGEWSDSTIGGSGFHARLKARLVVSETTDDSGSRTAIVYVEFQNTNHLVNTLYFYWGGTNSTLDCELRDSSAKSVPRAWNAYSGVIPDPIWLALPEDSILRFRPDLVDWSALNGELTIDAGSYVESWRIPRGDTNDYYLSGTLTLTIPSGIHPPTLPGNNIQPIPWQGTLKLPPVKISAKSPSVK
jgi:hypothetical protein